MEYDALGPLAPMPAQTSQLSQPGMVWMSAWVTAPAGTAGADGACADAIPEIPSMVAPRIAQRLTTVLNISSDTPELRCLMHAFTIGAKMETNGRPALDQSIS